MARGIMTIATGYFIIVAMKENLLHIQVIYFLKHERYHIFVNVLGPRTSVILG